ncbi:hypothetical protein ABZ756_05045 [Mammaliicoccus sciuri]|uniref:tetratricopeptide repeat protein n=1 Tax=Sporosarcina TaxID=1569 RepID=UPI001C8E7C9C|nr:hypothetical protein [Sporosarcina aquimarina]MBY0223119.1 hypothetical protein [Sporosarcina aquimarina]
MNKKALQLFENNQYDEALSLLEKVAKAERTVQSLNNLAFMYLYEEEDVNRAKPLLEEVVLKKPQSHFPYSMLGEIAIREKQWIVAKDYLQKSIDIFPTPENIHNLAVAQYHLGDFEMAAAGFNRVAKDSDVSSWYEVLARIENKDYDTAQSILDQWNDQSDDYAGAIEAADAYVEMNCFEKARDMFEKEWDEYAVTPYVISRYAYTLFRLDVVQSCHARIQQGIEKKCIEIEEVKQEECDEHWSELDKQEIIDELRQECTELHQLFPKLQSGYRPPIEIELNPTGGCYLFGCQLHMHEEYVE